MWRWIPALALSLFWGGAAQAQDGDIQLQDPAGIARTYADSWVRYLPDMLPGIQACLRQANASQAFVTFAWPMNHGLVSVRIQTGTGMRSDCIVENPEGRIVSFIPIARQTDPLPGEGDVSFFPDRQCVDARRVLMGTRIVGWLAYPACRKPD